MLTIGLCGPSGSGKGYVCKKFKEYGVEYIDTDKVYVTRVVVPGSKCLEELSMFFGKDIIAPDGSLDKARLSTKVFEGENASQRLKVLNTITHKYIKTDVQKTLEQNRENGVKATLIDAPVLFESGFDEMCDFTICVTAPEKLRIERIIKRDGISRAKALARIQSQLTNERLRELCNFEIVNDDGSDLDGQILSVINKLGLE